MAKQSKKQRTKKREAKRNSVNAKATEVVTVAAVAAKAAEEVAVAKVAQASEPPAAELVPQSKDATPEQPFELDEHREFPRVALHVDINLASESHFFSGLSGDLSEGGVFVCTYRDVDIGSPVDVGFTLPNGEIQAHGVVRWHRSASDSAPPGVGIAFDDLSDEQKILIQAFCQRRAPLYYEVDASA